MRNRAALVGLVLSIATLLWATAGWVGAKPGSHGKALGHAKTHGSASSHTSSGESSGGGGGNSISGGGSSDPNGNNGTVKVDGVVFDSAPNNEPHPGCTFQIDFYGYDEGALTASYEFDLHPPSGTGELATGTLSIGQDAAGGGTDLDASTATDLATAFDLNNAAANPNQGYHVKLTVHAPQSIGSDVKHKVFWVECGNTETGGVAGAEAGAGPAGGEVSSNRAAASPGAVRNAGAAHAVAGSPAFTG